MSALLVHTRGRGLREKVMQYQLSARDQQEVESHYDPQRETQYWTKKGTHKMHRLDGPALIENVIGRETWYVDGKIHRDDGPAITEPGVSRYLQQGKLHRDNDLPAVTFGVLGNEWFIQGERHRDNDQPAVIWATGEQEWFQHGKRHRENGPAHTYPDTRQAEYWLDNQQYTEEEHAKEIKWRQVEQTGHHNLRPQQMESLAETLFGPR